MHIHQAHPNDYDAVRGITHQTITAVYPRYYPAGAVQFFLAHHSDESIRRDIHAGCVYLLEDDGRAVGTVTLNGSELNRLFVLPECQGKGYGRRLLDFAEATILAHHAEITLSASLPAKPIYIKRGYRIVDAHEILTDNGDVLCYDQMTKPAQP